mgnify:CR=1 FL=1|tara:strand:- start:547 stop:696 length:150 start_codon:yes stop_codon:yes gene_type:complete
MEELLKVLEKYFSLHDVDQIYNLLSEFSEFDTNCGSVSFEDWLIKKGDK